MLRKYILRAAFYLLLFVLSLGELLTSLFLRYFELFYSSIFVVGAVSVDGSHIPI